MSWDQRSSFHLFCTSVFEGININHPSPELLMFYHNWNRRAILVEEKGEKHRTKTQLHTLTDLNSGFGDMNVLGLRCWWTILSPTGFFFLISFLYYCWWPATAVAEQNSRGKRSGFIRRIAAVAARSLAGRGREPHAGMKILSALACDGSWVFFILF